MYLYSSYDFVLGHNMFENWEMYYANKVLSNWSQTYDVPFWLCSYDIFGLGLPGIEEFNFCVGELNIRVRILNYISTFAEVEYNALCPTTD